MGYFAGLDVSLEETAICIVDAGGRIVREARAASEPEVLVAYLVGMRDEHGAGWARGLLADSLAACRADGGQHPGDLHRDAPGQGGDGRHAEQD